MTHDDIVDVLTAAAAFDQRTVGRADVIAWHAAIGTLPKDDAIAGVVAHYCESEDRLKPVHVIRHVEATRAARLRKHGEIVPELDPDDPRWNARYQQMHRAVMDGLPVPPLSALPPLQQRAIEAP